MEILTDKLSEGINMAYTFPLTQLHTAPYLCRSFTSDRMQLQQHCRDNSTQFSEYPFLALSFFNLGKAFHTGLHPHLASKQPSKNVEAPFGPQRRNMCMLQFYRKCSDMTARVITSPMEGTPNLWAMERYDQVGGTVGGMEGVPGTLKG